MKNLLRLAILTVFLSLALTWSVGAESLSPAQIDLFSHPTHSMALDDA